MSTTKGDMAAFETAYEGLNAAQREAVDSIDGPVMVVAGPGTGKTQILTLRIANILLQTDMQPGNILALTFTESGAKAMRERLRKYIGAAAYQVPIYTFHGFAAKLIGEYPDSYYRVIGGRPINDLEKITLIETILNGGEIKKLRPMGNPEYYVPHILRIIGQLKQEYITPDAFVKIIEQQETELLGIEKIHEKGAHKGKVRGEYTKKEEAITKNRELLFVYRRYEVLLSEQNFFDFEDMIVETVKALQDNEDMLRDLQETYQYILADEHQDVNGSQNKILELLASFHDSPNIFAVGDEKQAIYRFQGASLENFLYFTEQFKGTKVISLTENYRSGQPILDVAHSLVEVEDGPLKELRVPLLAKAVKDATVTRRDFSHQAVEDTWLVESVQAEMKKGIAPSEIAVIVRTNREVEAVSTLLRKAGLAVTASADGDILRHPITQAVQGLINAVITDKSTVALFTVLHGAYWGINTNDLLKVLSAQSYARPLWQILSDEEVLKEIGVQDVESVTNVVRVLEEARKREVHEAPHRVLEYILQESGFLKHLMEYDPFEGTRVIRRLYDEIESMVSRDGVGSLREVSAAFSTRMSYGLPLNAPFIVTDPESVQVMTAHKSKGLEFEVVYLPHITDSGWGGGSKKRYFDIPLPSHTPGMEHEFIEDERRLLYVAMTRAKQTLSISSSGTNSAGKELIPARLLEEIEASLIFVCDTSAEDAKFNPLAVLEHSAKPVEIDGQLLLKLLSERGFSATSLNNYLKSPWDYFFRNVLRIPETQAVHMQFGTAMHAVLEYVTRYHTQTGTVLSDTEIKKKLETALNKLPVNTEEYVRLLEKGFEALMLYVPHMAKTLPKTTKEEFKLRVHLPTGIPEIPELVLTGNLDRIDIGDDGYALRVVDYKTGKPKSRNVIEGNTKDSDGGYKRQLVFYALLLSLHDDERYLCREGVLSFVESDGKGGIKEESFAVTDEEIEDLKQTIIVAVGEIMGGEFLSQPCSEEESEYSELAKRWQVR
jgi:DNA helicase II / ATP-dependent DNA helicase PcrA